MKKTIIPILAASSMFWLNAEAKNFAYIYGDVSANGAIPSGNADPYDPMRLDDTGDTGTSTFRDLVLSAGHTITEHYDAATTFDATFFSQYDAVIFGLHQELLTTAEKAAMDTWIRAGGSIMLYSDSASGGKFNRVGGQNPVGQTAVNNKVADYGMQVLVDQGGNGGGIPVLQSGTTVNHPVITENLVLVGEGVSPFAIDTQDPNYSDFTTLIPYTYDPLYLVSGDPHLSHLQGMTISNPEYAALAIKDVDNGHIIGLFDRQPMWNNGTGAHINDEDNKQILDNLIKFMAGDLGSTPSTITLDTTTDVLVSTAGVANLDGTINSGNPTSLSWSKVSGPGTVTFTDASVADTQASFSQEGVYELALTASNSTNSATSTVLVEVVDAAGVVIAIDAGRTAGTYVSSTGFTYSADANYNVIGKIDTVTSAITNTEDDSIYSLSRSQMGGYSIPVNNGDYMVLLQYTETYFQKVNGRVFSSTIEGTVADTALDLYAINGARYAAYDSIHETTVTDGVLNIDFAATKNNELISGIVVVELPQTMASTTIEAEDYDGFFDTTVGNKGGQLRTDNVDIGLSVAGEYFVGWVIGGEYLEYNLDVPTAQDYTFTFRLASAKTANRKFHVEVNGVNVTGTIAFNTGGAGWEAWQDVVVTDIPLAAGVQTVKIVMETSGMNFDNYTITEQGTGTTQPIAPIDILAVDYDDYLDTTPANEGGQLKTDGVDISLSAAGDYYVSHIKGGEYLDYTVDIPEALIADFTFRVGTKKNFDKRIQLTIDGVPIDMLTFKTRNGWENWTEFTLTDIPLYAGQQVIRLEMLDGQFNLESFTITPK